MGYYDIAQRKIDLNGTPIIVFTKPGMVAWEEVAAATSLLAAAADLAPSNTVLVLEGGCGALAVWASQRCREVHYYDFNLIAARVVERTLAANPAAQFTINAGIEPESVDTVLMPIPKGRALSQYLLTISYSLLKPDGRLYLAGANDAGAKAVIKDAGEIFGQAVTLRTKASNRVAVATKSLDPQPLDERLLSPQHFQALGLELFSLPGVFSAGELDDGTATLIATLDEKACENRCALDMGCGSGIIGMAAACLGASSVDLVDGYWLALQCAQQGIDANGLAQCRVIASDLYADLGDAKYDLILSNPPFHSGHTVDTQAAEALIKGSWEHLTGSGRLRIVANRFLPYDKLIKATFGAGNTRVIVDNGKYWVLEGKK